MLEGLIERHDLAEAKPHGTQDLTSLHQRRAQEDANGDLFRLELLRHLSLKAGLGAKLVHCDARGHRSGQKLGGLVGMVCGVVCGWLTCVVEHVARRPRFVRRVAARSPPPKGS